MKLSWKPAFFSISHERSNEKEVDMILDYNNNNSNNDNVVSDQKIMMRKKKIILWKNSKRNWSDHQAQIELKSGKSDEKFASFL